MRWTRIVRLSLPPLLIQQPVLITLRVSVNVFYHINQEHPESSVQDVDVERTKQEREFKIGSIGFADSLGILLAAVAAVPTEVELCKAQIQRGKTLCKGL